MRPGISNERGDGAAASPQGVIDDERIPEKDQRHRERMERKKAVVDEKIAQARDERGVLLVHSGNGKGKSSSAFGMVARALGHGMKVGVVQFIKGAASTGEEAFFRRFPRKSATT